MCLYPDHQVVQARALAKDTVLCSSERHLTLTVPLSMGTSKVTRNAGVNFAVDYAL